MDWKEFIAHTPDKISVPRFKGSIGGLMGFQQTSLRHSTTLMHLVRAVARL